MIYKLDVHTQKNIEIKRRSIDINYDYYYYFKKKKRINTLFLQLGRSDKYHYYVCNKVLFYTPPIIKLQFSIIH